VRKLVCCLAALLASSIASAQDEQTDRVLAKYDKIRPSERELAMYRLDWADSLSDAQKRATREGRPIVLIIIHAKYGDILSGHC
jgi:hypothetical protein